MRVPVGWFGQLSCLVLKQAASFGLDLYLLDVLLYKLVCLPFGVGRGAKFGPKIDTKGEVAALSEYPS